MDALAAIGAEQQSGKMDEGAKSVCLEVTKSLKSEDRKSGGVFSEPVDYMGLGLPQYPEVIKNPMDLGTVLEKLTSNSYATERAWADDIELVFKNAETFNPPDHSVYALAGELRGIFNKLMAKAKDAWRKKAKKVLKAVLTHSDAYPFLEEVNWEELGIPEYPEIIKKPMHLNKVSEQLEAEHYQTIDAFVSDVRLVSRMRRHSMKRARRCTTCP